MAGTEPLARLAASVGLGAGALGCAVGLLATSGWLISRAAQHPPVLELSVAVTAVRAFGLGRGVLRYAERLVSHDTTFRILASLRARIYARLERLGPAGLPAFRRGDLLARFVADVDTIQERYLRVLLPAAGAVLVGVGASVGAALLLPAAGVALAGALLLAGVAVPGLTAATAAKAERVTIADRAALTAATVELLRGAPELVAYGTATERLAEVVMLDRRLAAARSRAAFAAGLGAGLTALSTGAAVLAALAAGAAAVTDGRMTGVGLAVIVLLPLAAFEAVAGLPDAARAVLRVRASSARLVEVFDATPPVTGPEVVRTPPETPFPLVVSGLRARWPGADRDALAGVDLRLEAGRRVAVVGASGAGKSTLAAVLLRFLPPAGGRYTLAWADVTGLDPDDVRRLVGFCAQDAHLFDSTIRANLELARPAAGEAELWEALGTARLAEWVRSLPLGLDTPVGERGGMVSGGQRQRLALARVLLADFPVVVLDEPGANLDPATADPLTLDLLAATADRATVLITHRLAGCEVADEVIVLDAGRVVQRGTPEALLAVDGPYRNWWRREQAADGPGHALAVARVGD